VDELEEIKAGLRRLAEEGHIEAARALGAWEACLTYLDAFMAAAVLALRALEAERSRGNVASFEVVRLRREALEALRKLMNIGEEVS